MLHNKEKANCLKIMPTEERENWPQISDGDLIQGETGRLTVSRKITFILT
jgi:hypothetical protein